MEATTWRIQTNNKDEFNYRLQIDGIKGVRAKNRILKAAANWNTVGEGHNRDKNFILLFARTFSDKKSWARWAKQFPYELAELKKNGDLKPIKRKVRA